MVKRLSETDMVVVYFYYTTIGRFPGERAIALYYDEQDLYPVNEQDLSWWIVPGTLED